MSNIFTDLLSLERTRSRVKEDNQKRLLQLASKLLAETLPDITSQLILEQLTQRERLGSTSLGAGIALPHARIVGLSEPIIALLSLDKPMVFDSIDKKNVDLFCILLVTADAGDEELQTLAKLANLFCNGDFCERLRAADSNESLYQAAIK
jgi:PTS system nitrogen regulatory IIA component